MLVCSCVHEFVWWSWSCSCSRSCLVCSSARLVHGVCVGVVFAVFVMVSCTCRWCIRVIVLCLWFNIPKLVCSWVHCVRGSSACVPIVRVWRGHRQCAHELAACRTWHLGSDSIIRCSAWKSELGFRFHLHHLLLTYSPFLFFWGDH